jgi:hypothetical protein
MNVKTLVNFKNPAGKVRASILGSTHSSNSKGDENREQGTGKNNLGLRHDDSVSRMDSRHSTHQLMEEVTLDSRFSLSYLGPTSIHGSRATKSVDFSTVEKLPRSVLANQPFQREKTPLRQDKSLPAPPQEICHPFFDPAMLDLVPTGEMPPSPQPETEPFPWDYVELGDYKMTSGNIAELIA